MKKKKLKAKIKKLKMQVVEARTSAVGAHIAKALVGAAIGGGGLLVSDGGEIAISKKPQAGEPEIIGKLRRMAEAAAAKGKSEP